MAKAQFNRNQRVWVEAVGAWSVVERIIPVWSKGFDEPIRILYDVGLGRDFTAPELRAEAAGDGGGGGDDGAWRVLRARNKWQSPADCADHPHPGTFPVVVTDPKDWGGWRTPGAEYERDPERIERQARLIAAAPRLRALAESLIEVVGDSLDDAPDELQALALHAARLLREVYDQPTAPQAVPGATAQSETTSERHLRSA